MPFSPKSLEEKPYNRCITCDHIGITCDGPNFLAMSMERWCEWVVLRKDYLGWTNARIAELANVSTVSVNRITSSNVKDLRMTTMQAITRVLVNGTWGQYPCNMAAQATEFVDNPELLARCEDQRRQLEDDRAKIDFLKQQVQFKEEQMQSKDTLLRERFEFLKRKDRVIALLGTCLAVAVLFIIVVLIYDLTHADIGYFGR